MTNTTTTKALKPTTTTDAATDAPRVEIQEASYSFPMRNQRRPLPPISDTSGWMVKELAAMYKADGPLEIEEAARALYDAVLSEEIFIDLFDQYPAENVAATLAALRICRAACDELEARLRDEVEHEREYARTRVAQLRKVKI